MANNDSLNVTPIRTVEFQIKISNFLKENNKKPVVLGIDFGCSLIKIVYVGKENSDCNTEDDLKMTAALFANPTDQDDYIERVLKWVNVRAEIKPIIFRNDDSEDSEEEIIITGLKSDSYRNLVKSVFGISCRTISEESSIIAGYSLGLRYIGIEALARSDKEFDVEYRQCEINGFNNFFDMFNKKNSENTDSSTLFPCLVLQGGSNATIVYYDKAGNGINLGVLIPCGKLLMGLSKSLIDVNDYKEVMELAMKGERANVDGQVKDNFTHSEPDSTYEIWPLEMPLFPFGKCMDIEANSSDVMAKEDLAASIVGMIFLEMFMSACLLSSGFKTTKIFFTGNFFNSDVFLKTHARITKYFYQHIEFKMLDFGYAGALACSLLHSNKAEEYVTKI